MQVKLLVEGHQVEIGWEALDLLIGDLPDDKSMAAFHHTLAASAAAAVRRTIARKSALLDETVALLEADLDPRVIEALVENHCPRISEPALREIIQRNWTEVNRALADRIDTIEHIPPTDVARLLAATPDPAVRTTLANQYRTPKAILLQLLSDPDPDVHRSARRTLDRR